MSNILEQMLEENKRQREKYEKQLAEFKAENERFNKALDMCKHIERYDIGDMLKENIQLKQQLKDNTKQVCEMIRNGYSNFDDLDKFDWQGFEEFLDRIEKGN